MFSQHPGVTAPGNRRPRKPGKMKSSQVKSGRKTAEVKATIPVKSPVKVMNLSADTTTITQDVGCSVHQGFRLASAIGHLPIIILNGRKKYPKAAKRADKIKLSGQIGR